MNIVGESGEARKKQHINVSEPQERDTTSLPKTLRN
jgi:hypothetical protein